MLASRSLPYADSGTIPVLETLRAGVGIPFEGAVAMLARANEDSVEIPVALTIRSRETEKLASALARSTAEATSEAIAKALHERLERVKRDQPRRSLADQPGVIAMQCAALPVLDARSPDELFGHDEHDQPRKQFPVRRAMRSIQ